MEKTSNLLEKLVNIRSSPRVSNKEIALFLEELFKGFEKWKLRQENDGVELFNLIVKIPSDDRKGKPLMVLMHTDTVEGSWFQKAKVESGKVIGLGSCDMKAGIACIIKAALKKKYPRDLYLCFSSDEESKGKGAELIKERITREEFELILIPEPSSMNAYDSQNSCVAYQVFTRGKSKHGSLNRKENNFGDNAIVKMSRIINYLNKELEEDKDIESQNIGVISGGVKTNIVPENCYMKFEQRFKPGINIDEKIKKTSSDIEEIGGKLDIRFKGDYFKLNNDSARERIREILEKRGVNCFEKFPAWSEAGIFKELGPCMVLGPGNLEAAHTENEYVDVKDLELFEKIYEEIFEKI